MEERKTSQCATVGAMCELQCCKPLVAWTLSSDPWATSSSRHHFWSQSCSHACFVFFPTVLKEDAFNVLDVNATFNVLDVNVV